MGVACRGLSAFGEVNSASARRGGWVGLGWVRLVVGGRVSDCVAGGVRRIHGAEWCAGDGWRGGRGRLADHDQGVAGVDVLVVSVGGRVLHSFAFLFLIRVTPFVPRTPVS